MILILLAWIVVAAAQPLRPARTSATEPPLPEELEAAEQLRKCRVRRFMTYVPGSWSACMGRKAEGAALAALTGTQLAAGVAVLAADPPTREELGLFDNGHLTFLLGATLPLVYESGRATLDLQRARRLPYVPRDTTGELFRAPFRPRVLARPDVAIGTLVLAGGAVALNAALGEPVRPMLGSPNVLGARPPPDLGYPALTLLHGGLMMQVATAEEIWFRGIVQSGLTRKTNPTSGWLLGSLVFGAVHVANLPFIPRAERPRYLAAAVPYITVAGSWLGLTYRWSGYSLAPPVAVHF